VFTEEPDHTVVRMLGIQMLLVVCLFCFSFGMVCVFFFPVIVVNKLLEYWNFGYEDLGKKMACWQYSFGEK
jgi:hypothetical protein